MGNELSLPRIESSCRASSGEAIRALVANIEAYYAWEYNDTQRAIIIGYLSDIAPELYEALYSQVLRTKLYSARLPLIEHFEEALTKEADLRIEKERQERIAKEAEKEKEMLENTNQGHKAIPLLDLANNAEWARQRDALAANIHGFIEKLGRVADAPRETDAEKAARVADAERMARARAELEAMRGNA